MGKRDRHLSEHWEWPIYEPDPQECVRTREGYAHYSFYERVAICLDSGIGLYDAINTASRDLQREISVK